MLVQVGRRVRASAHVRSFATFPYKKEDMETEDYIIFPRERPGLDYDLNWSLNANGVTPAGDAFHLSKAADAAKIGKVAALGAAAVAAPEAGESGLSFVEFEAALEKAKAAFCSAPNLYVAEGDVPGTRVPCRVITDSPDLAATAMASVLERMPKKFREVQVGSMAQPITCFVSKGSKGSGAFEGFVVEQGDGVIYKEDAVVADVVLTGAMATPEKLHATIKAAAEELQK